MKNTTLVTTLWLVALGIAFAVIQGATVTQTIFGITMLALAGLVIGARWSHLESRKERPMRPDLAAARPPASRKRMRLRYLALWSVFALPLIIGGTSVLLGMAQPAFYFAAGLAIGLANSVTLYVVGTPAGRW